MSKGSNQRPTDKRKFDSNYDAIFRKEEEFTGQFDKWVEARGRNKAEYFESQSDDQGTPVTEDH